MFMRCMLIPKNSEDNVIIYRFLEPPPTIKVPTYPTEILASTYDLYFSHPTKSREFKRTSYILDKIGNIRVVIYMEE